ncbi:MAG TPA: DUF4124 domain-containing protein [Usitatibacter sp.]|nr:DUF4124 domain-containing protein [Usitatibacter sp.]
MDLLRTTALLLATATLASPAMGTVLYKSIAANGVVEFSDVPPTDNSKLVEERQIGRPVLEPAAAITTAAATVVQTTPVAMESLIADEAVARASEKVDLAEHALAVARQGLWSPRDGLHLRSPGRTAADEQRLEFFKRGVIAARQALMDTLRERLASR